MNNDLDTNMLISQEERMISLAIKTAGIVVATFFLGIATCSMHSNIYEADVIHAEAKLEVEKTKATEAEAKVRIEKIQAMERMINAGANPIAIRCMDKGFGNDNDVCLAVGVAIGKINPANVE